VSPLSTSALLALVACGHDVAAPADTADVIDVRVALPDPDPSYIDLVTPDFTIEPGSEAIYCFYTDNRAGQLAIDGVVDLVGAGNHHIAFRKATTPRPDGTFEACTSSADQTTLDLDDIFVGGGSLPAGWAVQIAADTQFVVETHYIDATDKPLLARDVLRVHRAANVMQWVASMHLKTYDLAVQPGDATLAFDCTAPADVDLLEFWGHMHGLGAAFHVDVDGTALYDIPAWQGGAPVIDAPAHVAAGSRLRVTCEWHNTTGHVVVYPDEMCAFGGFVRGLDGWSCTGTSYPP
jgi:hypothetical protein